ncbi:MAG TPA: hypothetical protein VL492_08080 [Methylovirgula sp.]|nr:hypothetical protein [Methylovirgula sp.]
MAFLCAVLCSVAFIAALRLGTFDQISLSLDASWQAAVGEMSHYGYVFGRDIIFTGGPLTSIYTRYFDEVQWPYAILCGVAATLVVGWAVFRLVRYRLAAIILPVVILLSYPDAPLLAVPLFGGLAILEGPQTPYIAILFVALCTAALSLAKFTVAIVALPTFAIIDFVCLRRRKFPISLAAFCLFLFACFALLERDASSFPDYIRYSMETAAGYSSAMGIDGSLVELIAFLTLALIAATFVIRDYWINKRDGRVKIFIAVIFVFVAFKAGFCRQDLHPLIAWSALAIVLALFSGMQFNRSTQIILAALSIGAIAIDLRQLKVSANVSYSNSVGERIESIGTNLNGLFQISTNTAAWLQNQESAMSSAKAAVRALMPLPKLSGSVDVLSSVQSAVIAAGLDYRPRFTLQEYTTYRQSLIDRNRQSWFGAKSPEHILFGLSPIDQRYPALSEGPLWPDLLRFYAPSQFLEKPQILVLDRRLKPIGEVLSPKTEQTTEFGKPFPIGNGPIFMKADIRVNMFGKLMTDALRGPKIDILLQYKDGSSRTYRLIPAIAKAGFVISPTIASAADYLALAQGDRQKVEGMAQVSSVTFHAGGISALEVEKDVPITLQTINLDPLAQGTNASGVKAEGGTQH